MLNLKVTDHQTTDVDQIIKEMSTSANIDFSINIIAFLELCAKTINNLDIKHI